MRPQRKSPGITSAGHSWASFISPQMALSSGKLTSPAALGVAVLWLPVGFGRWEAPTGNGRGREERATGYSFLGFGSAPAWWPSPSGTGLPRVPGTAPALPLGAHGWLELSCSCRPQMLRCPIPIPLNAVYTFVNSPFIYTAVNHLFEECHLFPAGSLGDVAVIGIAFSLRSISDFLCSPRESAILSEPQFLYLLNEPTMPPAFPVSAVRCEN